jgi:hypothetical protein
MVRKGKIIKYKIAIPPNVLKLMFKKQEEFKLEVKDIKFLDPARTRVKFNNVLTTKAASRMAVLHKTEPEYGCMDVAELLGEHGTAATWKVQYRDLPEYESPATKSPCCCHLTESPRVRPCRTR